MTERVRVAVRVRPLNAREASEQRSAVRCASDRELELSCPSAGGVQAVKTWTFDVCAHAGLAE